MELEELKQSIALAMEVITPLPIRSVSLDDIGKRIKFTPISNSAVTFSQFTRCYVANTTQPIGEYISNIRFVSRINWDYSNDGKSIIIKIRCIDVGGGRSTLRLSYQDLASVMISLPAPDSYGVLAFGLSIHEPYTGYYYDHNNGGTDR